MTALLGREFVNVPLLCGTAEHSHDASGPPSRGALGSSLSCGGSSFSLHLKAQLPSVLVPLQSPSWDGSYRSLSLSFSLSSRLCNPSRCPLSLSRCALWSTPGPLWLGQPVLWPPPHCVLPDVSARTRCRLMASSRNPATFSLSSCTAQGRF